MLQGSRFPSVKFTNPLAHRAITNGHTGRSFGVRTKGILAGFGRFIRRLLTAMHADKPGRQEKDYGPPAMTLVKQTLVRVRIPDAHARSWNDVLLYLYIYARGETVSLGMGISEGFVNRGAAQAGVDFLRCLPYAVAETAFACS
jgi:hypothetical protein